MSEVQKTTEVTELPVENPDRESLPEPVSLMASLVTLFAITAPLLGVIAAPFFVWGWGFRWTDMGVLIGMYLLTSIGITVGFHRLFVHRSFETSTFVKVIYGILGSMAVQGSLFTWVGMHRRHHQHSDTPDDPHTPHHHGGGVLGVLKGFWHSHIGWFFSPNPPDMEKYVKDLSSSRAMRIVDALFLLWVALGLFLPALIGGLITQSWSGVWTGLIWGGLVRVFVVHHITWSVNSACHLWGMRPFDSDDMSRNNIVFGILAMGEGWHNSHHAFPTSARHGLSWWQIDVSYYVIRTMSIFRIAWGLKLPSKEAQARERRKSR